MNKIVLDLNYEGMRLDKVLSSILKDKSRTYLVKLIDDGHVFVNGKIAKPALKIKAGDVVTYEIPPLEALEVEKENIPLDIIYEDSDLLVVNKQQGMIVHTAVGHHRGNLVNALMGTVEGLSGIGGTIRPGIVHRIDKDTSGLLVVSKNDKAHLFLASQLKNHTMQREYYALVKGIILENEGKIDLTIGRSKINRQKMAIDPKNGKSAITYFQVEKRFVDHTLISCKLKTGRTHQIRVHFSYIGHPIEGDTVYGSKKSKLYKDGQLLHAYRLTFIHPTTKKEMAFSAPLPDYFEEILTNLN